MNFIASLIERKRKRDDSGSVRHIVRGADPFVKDEVLVQLLVQRRAELAESEKVSALVAALLAERAKVTALEGKLEELQTAQAPELPLPPHGFSDDRGALVWQLKALQRALKVTVQDGLATCDALRDAAEAAKLALDAAEEHDADFGEPDWDAMPIEEEDDEEEVVEEEAVADLPADEPCAHWPLVRVMDRVADLCRATTSTEEPGMSAFL